jgi:hypothetical protein
VAIENKGQGTPIIPKPESRGGQPLQRLKMKQPSRGGRSVSMARAALVKGACSVTPKGVVRTGRETCSTLTGPRPSSNPTRATVSSGVPQGPGTAADADQDHVQTLALNDCKGLADRCIQAALPCHTRGSISCGSRPPFNV